ncbi:LytR/AlgR family response regulator transcription factor [Flavobacterium aciduliphilum]|uniref:LytTR family two component transcriptional regulator n=1 Tax=Flavobacterium aciduliphilum TaxID=1101402 RepID=A0A328YMX3_9FLAO|nr:LytTR family DNA-binding domain-containing protein [Flavobacterium aciduliphilum]RAR75458.1 LytTR family two component transcriptional regulator [Flavobacterium aciduliphilum]
MKLNCIVVDDSTIQRAVLVKLINNHSFLNLLGDFENPIEAKNCIETALIDIMFLDIEMPIISGFDFIDSLKIKPQIIITSSKADYALKAFEYNVTDYIQKPINVNRFNVAIKKAIELYNFRRENNEEDGEFIFIKSNLKKLKVYLNKIKWIEAYGDYVKVVTEDETNLVLSTMKAFENELPNKKFIRVHKSYIINIEKVERYSSKSAEIGVFNIPLSRTKKENLIKALASL